MSFFRKDDDGGADELTMEQRLDSMLYYVKDLDPKEFDLLMRALSSGYESYAMVNGVAIAKPTKKEKAGNFELIKKEVK